MRVTIAIYVLLIFSNLESDAQAVKVLFIGNSYVSVNNLPALFQGVALANGDTVIVDSSAPGGTTFEMHCTNATTLAKIYSQQWDYVILQEQSQLPSFPPSQVLTEVYPFAMQLDSLIHDNNPCTETVFYMTWGRKNGDAANCPFYPPLCTYDGMQARLRESYLEMALMNGSTVGPVGAAWSHMRSLNPAFDLYQPDESHPTIHGSYLAACTFYAALFHNSPVGTTFISSLPLADATAIQNAVQTVVNDSIALWYEHGNIPMASYSYSSTGINVQFTNHSLNATNYTWDFGDGNNSTLTSPSHSYSLAGTYTVTLTAANGCRTDVITHTVTTGVTSLDEKEEPCSVATLLNSRVLHFNCDKLIREVALYDLNGRKIQGNLKSKAGTFIFEFDELPAGIYIAAVTGDDFYWSDKITVIQ